MRTRQKRVATDTWRSLGCPTTPLEHWSRRKPTVEALAQAIGENSPILMQNGQTTDQNKCTRIMTECAGHIANSLEEFSFGDINGQGIGNGEGKIPFNIKTFEGNPQDFETWVKKTEKHSLFSCNDRKKQLVTYQNSTGLVSDYIKRYLSPTPGTRHGQISKKIYTGFLRS